MRSPFKQLISVNFRFATRQYRKALSLGSIILGPDFTRNAYLEIFTVLRYVFLIMPVVYLPFACYDFLEYFRTEKYPAFIIYDLIFYPAILAMNLVLNFSGLHRASMARLKLVCRLGVLFLSLSGTCFTIVLFQVLPEFSIFAAAMLGVAILFRFPDSTKYYLYALNYAILYAFIFYNGIVEPILLQNPLFVFFLIIIFDRVTYLTMANNYLKTRHILQLNQRLQREDVDKSDMISIAVHDLKSPLSGIMSISRLMRENMVSFPDLEKTEILSDIEASSRKILSKIEDLVDIAAAGFEDAKVTYEMFDINSFIYAAVQNFNYQASLKRIEFYTRFEKNYQQVYSDKKAVSRILDNLVSNAVKFSPSGGTIFIQSRALQHEGEFVQVEIRDEGPGFTEQDRQRIYSRFTRLSARPTADESSTGIGLFAVNKMIEVLNARILLTSESGKGSVFTVTFPAAALQREGA